MLMSIVSHNKAQGVKDFRMFSLKSDIYNGGKYSFKGLGFIVEERVEGMKIWGWGVTARK